MLITMEENVMLGESVGRVRVMVPEGSLRKLLVWVTV